MRIALGLEYDGSAFCGWQTQPTRCSVQDALQAALSEIAGHRVNVITAGRTDAGVHAIEQVVHFEAVATRPLTAWVRGANALLPGGLVTLWAHEVRDDFHARFSALSRTYCYALLNRSLPPAVARGRVGWYHRPLDEAAMARAAKALVGERDFSAFRGAQCQARSPVRRMFETKVERRGDVVCFEFRANAFLQHMVRNLVGSLVYVGNGNHPESWIAELLAGRDRTRAAPTFSAEGLYLIRVEYADEWGLPQTPRHTSALDLGSTANRCDAHSN